MINQEQSALERAISNQNWSYNGNMADIPATHQSNKTFNEL
jgi:hypothetical protein